MQKYHVMWVAEVVASSPANAATYALDLIRDPQGGAEQFMVKEARADASAKLVRLDPRPAPQSAV